ncbi:unnamed protein product [Tilletia controversa]|nr:unnamed protein product [Tilletia controversa]
MEYRPRLLSPRAVASFGETRNEFILAVARHYDAANAIGETVDVMDILRHAQLLAAEDCHHEGAEQQQQQQPADGHGGEMLPQQPADGDGGEELQQQPADGDGDAGPSRPGASSAQASPSASRAGARGAPVAGPPADVITIEESSDDENPVPSPRKRLQGDDRRSPSKRAKKSFGAGVANVYDSDAGN